jgi:hypothetical protein
VPQLGPKGEERTVALSCDNMISGVITDTTNEGRARWIERKEDEGINRRDRPTNEVRPDFRDQCLKISKKRH